MNTIFKYEGVHLTQSEEGALVWLAQRQRWVSVSIERYPYRNNEFDLKLEGVHMYGGRYGIREGECGFKSWAPLACIREFWSLGLLEQRTDDWSFIRDRDRTEHWAMFYGAVAKQKAKLEREAVERRRLYMHMGKGLAFQAAAA